jgi:hypothetical protein
MLACVALEQRRPPQPASTAEGAQDSQPCSAQPSHLTPYSVHSPSVLHPPMSPVPSLLSLPHTPQADEEMLLLEGIEIYGMGNWPKVAGQSICAGCFPQSSECCSRILSVRAQLPCLTSPSLASGHGMHALTCCQRKCVHHLSCPATLASRPCSCCRARRQGAGRVQGALPVHLHRP